MLILAGDLGGTKTLLQLCSVQGGVLEVLHQARFDSSHYADFDSLLEAFLAAPRAEGMVAIDAACIGVAGPVTGTQARVTNLPWVLQGEALRQRFGLARLRLINDFQAVGYGIDALAEDDVLVLQAGQAVAQAPRALIGAGTGLGEGILVWQDDHYEVLPSEGGHVDFAPTDAAQRAYLGYMCQRQARVSYEDVVSGKGLVSLYEFLVQQEDAPSLDLSSGAAAVTAAAQGGDRLAAQALAMFVEIYGAQAGNLALTCLAAGGVYIAGGIAPRIRTHLSDGRFLAAFQNKGAMRSLLERYPVRLILDTEIGLKGAALVAQRLAG
jgi:glucokinase